MPPQVCSETYGVCPDVVLSGDVGAQLAYIPAHMDYMLYELLKNGARAVVEGGAGRQGQGLLAKLPPIQASVHGVDGGSELRRIPCSTTAFTAVAAGPGAWCAGWCHALCP